MNSISSSRALSFPQYRSGLYARILQGRSVAIKVAAGVMTTMTREASSKATTSSGRLNSMHPQDYRDSAREAAPNMFDWRDPLGNRSGPMATAKQFKAAIPA